MPSAAWRAREATQPSAAGTSGARTAAQAKAANRRAGSETLPDRRSSITARRTAGRMVVSVRAAFRGPLAKTSCSIDFEVSRPGRGSASPPVEPAASRMADV